MRYFMIIIAVLWWYMLLLLSRSYEFISEIYVEKFFFLARETRNKSSARSDPIQHYKFPIIYRFILPRIRLPPISLSSGFSFSRRPLKCFNIFFRIFIVNIHFAFAAMYHSEAVRENETNDGIIMPRESRAMKQMQKIYDFWFSDKRCDVIAWRKLGGKSRNFQRFFFHDFAPFSEVE